MFEVDAGSTCHAGLRYRLMRIALAAILYVAIVFAAGFVLGAVRVLVLERDPDRRLAASLRLPDHRAISPFTASANLRMSRTSCLTSRSSHVANIAPAIRSRALSTASVMALPFAVTVA
jgi:hypothetical protein